jgi:hypothetical protein
MAPLLMHHSRTLPLGLPGGDSVGPRMVITSCITVAPVIGSVICALGSSTAILLWPLPARSDSHVVVVLRE